MKLQNLIHIVIGILCIGLLPKAQAVVPPPPGGYPNYTTAAGDHALQTLTSGLGNTAIGTYSLFSIATGSYNTAVGAGALDLNRADSNTATGAAALLFNTIGTENTANGTAALEFNETGSFNTAVGAFALFSNTGGQNSGGSFNTAVGDQALFSNTDGFLNTANGHQALFGNTRGSGNTATGEEALRDNTTGGNNTACGQAALALNTTGFANTAIGAGALNRNTTGYSNVAIGDGALAFNDTGSDNTALGFEAGLGVTTANNVIAIGKYVAGADVSNTTWIGNVYGVTTQSGTTAPVIVSDSGQLGIMASSERFKKDISTMEKASEVIMSLRPVTFHYKTDEKGVPQFGLIAEEVAKVNPALVLPDKEGKPYTVRYDAVNAMLLNEFLKEHQRVQALEKQVEKLTAGLQKVSAQLEATKPAPQVVNNP